MGFKIDNVFFGWKDGVLYQLPYEYGGRYFALRKLRKKVSKSGWEYYHLRRKKVGIEKLRAMLQGVEWEVRNPYELK
jgi:hypothetical protein